MTTDGGAHWRDVSPPMLKRKGLALANGLAGATFLSPSDFFVSLSYEEPLWPAVVFHTTDGGKKWLRAGSVPGGGAGIWLGFANDRYGWALVVTGLAMGQESVTIYETTTGGGHWSVISRSNPLVWGPGIPLGTPQGPSVGCDKTGFSFSGTGTTGLMWLTGQSAGGPCLARSTDGGRRWTNLVLPILLPPAYGGAIPPVFCSASSGALSAWYGNGAVTAVYSTTNGGKTWVEHRTPSAKPALLDVVSSTTWFAALGKTIYHMTNGGVSWSRIAAPVNFGSYSGRGTLDFVNTEDGWTLLGTQVWHTIDGGHMWTSEVLPT
jgi:photosystem II stability/assembly factor-like uncharacterized protein